MVKNITKDELRNMMSSWEDFILIDVLSKDSFEEIHISGAINCPVEEIEIWAKDNLEKRERKIVLYCGSYTCTASARAAYILDRAGFTNVMRYEGGIKEWDEAGYPVYNLGVRAA